MITLKAIAVAAILMNLVPMATSAINGAYGWALVHAVVIWIAAFLVTMPGETTRGRG